MADPRAARCRVIVHGTVQGVFFRDTCRRRATEAGVSGWIRNNADGTVEAVFEGSPAAVEQLVGWCRAGPERAVVEHVDVEQEAPAGESGFHVV